MFKIVPLIISIALAGAGGAAVGIPAYLQTNTHTQSSVNANVQNTADLQDSSDLFLNANTNLGVNTNVNSGADTSTPNSGVDSQASGDLQMNIGQ